MDPRRRRVASGVRSGARGSASGSGACQETYDWFKTEAARGPAPECIFTQGMMRETLDGLEAESSDLIHLSNILDWLSPQDAAATLRSAWRVLKPGGRTIVRQLNSTLDIPGLPSGFEWDPALGKRWLEQDRSFFYRAIHLGPKL